MNYYYRYYRTLLRGQKRKPRGLPIFQMLNQTLNLPYGTTFRRKGDNPAIGFMEGMQFLAGTFELEHIARIAPHAKLELFTAQAAYGPRLIDQLAWVVDELKNDIDSRRAVIVLAAPREKLSERPCTTSLQFLVNHSGYLEMTVTLRSSDAVWGLPYDLIQHGIIHQVVSHCLRIPPGRVCVNIGSAHVYESIQVEGSFKTWSFEVPRLYTNVSEWQSWALAEYRVSDAQYFYRAFDFKEAKTNE